MTPYQVPSPRAPVLGPQLSVRQEVDLLLDEHVQELEERRGGEADHVLVVAVDLAHEHPAEALRGRARVSRAHVCAHRVD